MVIPTAFSLETRGGFVRAQETDKEEAVQMMEGLVPIYRSLTFRLKGKQSELLSIKMAIDAQFSVIEAREVAMMMVETE